MRSREELVGESARNPQGVAEYALELQEQLSSRDQALFQKDQLLAQRDQLLAQREQLLIQKDQLLAEANHLLAQKEQLLAEARAYIAELKEQLFGPKADKLSPEQEEQLQQLAGDVQEQAQRPAPLRGGARIDLHFAGMDGVIPIGQCSVPSEANLGQLCVRGDLALLILFAC